MAMKLDLTWREEAKIAIRIQPEITFLSYTSSSQDGVLWASSFRSTRESVRNKNLGALSHTY